MRVRSRALQGEEKAFLKEIWARINYKATYRVALDSARLRRRILKLFGDFGQYEPVKPPELVASQASLDYKDEVIVGSVQNRWEEVRPSKTVSVPDPYRYIQERVDVTRATLYHVLTESGRLAEMLVNPQLFLDMCVRIIKAALREQLVEGLKYQKTGEHYSLSLLTEEDFETWSTAIFPHKGGDMRKTLLAARSLVTGLAPTGATMTAEVGDSFECVRCDSDVEKRFARDVSGDGEAHFFFKLPLRYRIKMPLGHYTPDWAVLAGSGGKVCFVVETKSTLEEGHRRGDENLKIKCGRKFFAQLAPDVRYEVRTSWR